MLACKHIQISVLGLLFVVGLGGVVLLVNHSLEANSFTNGVPVKLPTIDIIGDASKPTIVFFYHPHCPCTRATIRNIERALTNCLCNPRIIAFAFIPEGKSESWIESDTTRKLRTFKGTQVYPDQAGLITRKFRVVTSGHILVYDRDKQLVFSGGVTSSRGHEGTCNAIEAFLHAANGEVHSSIEYPAFGCSIVDENSATTLVDNP